jgi:hypothetical protein
MDVSSKEGIEYKINIPVYPNPNCGPLCIFDSLERALDFAEHEGSCNNIDYFIFRAEYTPTTSKAGAGNYVIWYWYHNIFLNEDHKIGEFKGHLPPGSILCDSITLLEEVKV